MAVFSTYLRNCDLAVPGSPSSSTLMSPRRRWLRVCVCVSVCVCVCVCVCVFVFDQWGKARHAQSRYFFAKQGMWCKAGHVVHVKKAHPPVRGLLGHAAKQRERERRLDVVVAVDGRRDGADDALAWGWGVGSGGVCQSGGKKGRWCRVC